MGLSSCSDPSTGPSENFWLSNAWDVLTVLGLGQRPALFLGERLLLKSWGLGVLCGLLRPTRPHPPTPTGRQQGSVLSALLVWNQQLGPPQDRFPGRTHPGIVLLFGLLVFRSLAWRKLSKSAAPGGRGRLWLPWEDGWCRLTSRGKTNSSTCDISPSQVEVLHHCPQSGSSGSHCPRMTRRLIVPLCFLPCCGSSDPGHKLALWWVGGWVGGSVLQDLLPCLSGQGAPAKSRLQLHPQGRPLSSWSLAFPGDLPGSPTGGQGVSVHPSEPAQLCSSEHTLLALGSSRIPCTRCSSRKVLPRHCSSSTTSWHVHSLQ